MPAPQQAPETLPTDLAGGVAATPTAQGLGSGIQMDDWDDDEPPTNIYSKEAAKEMAKASLAMKATQEVPAPRRVPHPMDVDDVPISPDEVRGRRWLLPTLTGLGVAFLLLVVFILIRGAGEKTGTVELFVEPAGLKKLEVVVDGVEKLDSNMSPFKKTLEVGEHTFTIKHSGYKDKRFTIAIKKGENIKRNIELERTSTGFFLETDPPGAVVFVDDRPYSEKTPVTVDDLEPKTYSVRIVKENYLSKTIEIDVTAGEIAQLPLKKLELKTVDVTFKTQPLDAEVTLIDVDNNKRKGLGKTPVTEVPVDSSKNYKVQFKKEGYETEVKPLDLPAGEEKVTLTVDLKRVGGASRPRPPRPPRPAASSGGGGGGNGFLSVQTRPWSRVSINGSFVRNTPLVNHSLRPGSYTVTVENPQFNIRKNFRVKIRSGKTTTLVRNLL